MKLQKCYYVVSYAKYTFESKLFIPDKVHKDPNCCTLLFYVPWPLTNNGHIELSKYMLIRSIIADLVTYKGQ